MPEPDATVAIPTRDGGKLLERTLSALARQTVEHELLVCDSGSSDDSVHLARGYGARVLAISPSEFSHGGTRNLLMREASGARVAFLTQDSEPASEHWLERLLGGLELEPDVGIAYGPYLARAEAAPVVRSELERWFASLAPDGRPRIDRLSERERERPSGSLERALPVLALISARGFFTDANACITRAAWERVPFREVPYAEDRVLAIDMLRAGYAKAFVPQAAVLHSHDYTAFQELRRCFDEWRGLREVYGWREPASPAHVTRQLRGALGGIRRELIAEGASSARRRSTLIAAGRHHVVRLAGALLGSRADLLPSVVRRRLSLERRAGFAVLDFDTAPDLPQAREKAL